MDVGTRHPRRLQHLYQVVHALGWQREVRMPRQRWHRNGRTAHGRLQQQAVGAAKQTLHQIEDMPAYPAAQIVGYHQYGWEIGTPEQLGGQGKAEGTGRVQFHVLRNQPFVLRIAGAQRRHALLSSSRGTGTEAYRAFVIDKRIACQQMAPTMCAGTQTEVVLLAIALAEGLHVERADIRQRLASYIHTEADGGRQFDAAAAVHGAGGAVDLRHTDRKS